MATIPTEVEKYDHKFILLNKRYKIFSSFYSQKDSETGITTFFLHTIIDDIVRILTVPMFFQAREKALKSLIEAHPEIKTDKARLNLIYELTHPIKFLLDSSMIKIDDAWTGALKQRFNINFGNVAIIIPVDLEKTKDNLEAVAHLSQTYAASKVVQNYTMGMEALKEMNKQKFNK